MKMNRRRREQRKKRIAAANVRRLRERYLADLKPAKASEYLHHLKEYHKKHPNMKVVLYLRDSTRAQGHKKNLDTYEKVLRKKLKKLNVPVIGCYREISSGWVLNGDRERLVIAARKARKYGAVILAPSTDRFLRSRSFNTQTNPDVLPTEGEFEELKKLTCGVPLVTLLHPDMPPMEVRGYQTRWGQKAKGNKGGRPKINKPGYKKQRRLEKLLRVLRLHNRGATLGDIMALTDTPKSTVRYWIFKYTDKGI